MVLRGLLVVVVVATDVAAVEPGCPASNVGINVIRAADGSRSEVVGELPELPHGTRELSYGPTVSPRALKLPGISARNR